MFHVKFFTFCFFVLFSQLQANNPPTKNISLQKVIHSFQVSPFKNKTQTDSLPLHNKSNIAVLVAQQVEKSRSLELKTNSEAKIFDINTVQSNILYVIHKFKELCIKWMTTFCDEDDRSDYIKGIGDKHNSAWGGDDDLCKQVQDVMYDGRLCRQYLYFNEDNLCTGGMFIPCDNMNNAKNPGAYFFHYFEPVHVSQSAQQLKVFQDQHINFVNTARNKANSMNVNQFTREREQIKEIWRLGGMSDENYYKYCQEIAAEENIFKQQAALLQQSQNTLQNCYNAEHPGFLARKIWKIVPADNTNYNQQQIDSALRVLQAEQERPKSQNKHVIEEARHILETYRDKADQINQQKKDIQDTIRPDDENIDQQKFNNNITDQDDQQITNTPQNNDQPVENLDNKQNLFDNTESNVYTGQDEINTSKEEEDAQQGNQNNIAFENQDSVKIVLDRLNQLRIDRMNKNTEKFSELKLKDSLADFKKREDIQHKFERHEIRGKNIDSIEKKSDAISVIKSINLKDTKLGEIQQQAKSSESKHNKPCDNKEAKSDETRDKSEDMKKNKPGEAQENKPGKNKDTQSGENEKDQNNSPEGKTDKTQNKSDESESKKDSTQSQTNTYAHYHDRIKPVKSIDQIRQEQNQEMKNFIQNAERASLYNDSPNRNSDFFGNKIGQMRREHSDLPIPKKEDTSWAWEPFNECMEKIRQENQQRWKMEQEIAAQRYIQQKKMEVALLDHHGYIYQRPEQDFIELVKNQIMLESARDKYNAMGSFSYDYWISYKPGQLNKIIRDCNAKTYSLTEQLQDQRIEWKKQSLQEIANKEKARLLQELADKINLARAEIDKNKADIQLLVTCGYVFQASKEVDQKLQETRQQLDDAITRSGKPLSLYNYWLNNNREELANKIKDLTQAKESVETEIDKERQAWQRKSLSQAHALQAYIKVQAQALREAEEARDATDQYFKQVITEKYTSFKERILEFITPNQDAKVDLENLTEYVDSNNLKSSKESIKDSDHRYTMPRTIAQAIRKQLIDESNFYSQKIKWHEINKIDCMLDSMVDAKNNMTVEFAQTGLQAFDDMQKSQSDKEYGYYKNKFTQCYDSLNKKLPTQSIGQSVESVKASDLDTMLQYYTATFENSPQDHGLYQDRFAKRSQALVESQEQVRTNQLVLKEHPMSSQARGFLMANNLNYAAFDTIKATSIQHCLTEENLDIIESSADLAMRHSDNIQIKEFSKQTCNLAIAAQQLNQQSKIQEAAALTDINAFLSLFGQSSIEIKIYADIARGFVKGTAQVLYKWHDFLKRLGNEPRKTLGQIGSDLQAIGRCINYAAAEIYEHTPMAYHDDNLRDVVDFIHNGPHGNQDGSKKSRKELRDERNNQVMKNGTAAALNASFNIVTNMIDKSFEDNIADITEFTLDGAITNKVTQGIFYLSKVAGTSLIEAGREISQLLPPKRLEETIKYMQTSSGELVAVLEKTGENLATIATQHAIACNAEKIAQIGSKIKRIYDKVGELTKPNEKNIDALKKSMESHLNSEKVLNPERLKTIKDVPQINLYREYTNNFSPEGLAKLKSEEILHLNLCEWLEPQARKINERIKQAGLKITEVRDGIQCVTEIHEFDLFHSLLGEVKPGSISCHTKGGHLLIPELKAALLDIGEIEHIGNGFFDIGIKYAERVSDSYGKKTFFPIGTSLEEAVDMIEKGIQNISKITNETPIGRTDQVIYQIQYNNQIFKLHIEKNRNIFYPFVG